MKNLQSILITVVSVFAAILLWSFRFTPPDVTLAQMQPVSTAMRTLHTTGTAVIRVRPDKAAVRLGVQTFALTPRESQAQNAKTAQAVLQAIRDQGILPQDIGTDYLALRPEYDNWEYGQRKIVGYWTDNAVIVTLHEVDKLSEVLRAALEAGATTVDDVTFSTTRARELRDQARAMAVKAAMEKARDLAGAVDLSVGEVQNIGENSWSSYYGLWNSRGQWSNLQQNVAQIAPSSGAPQPEDGEFSLGQIVIQAQVDLTVAFK